MFVQQDMPVTILNKLDIFHRLCSGRVLLLLQNDDSNDWCQDVPSMCVWTRLWEMEPTNFGHVLWVYILSPYFVGKNIARNSNLLWANVTSRRYRQFIRYDQFETDNFLHNLIQTSGVGRCWVLYYVLENQANTRILETYRSSKNWLYKIFIS